MLACIHVTYISDQRQSGEKHSTVKHLLSSESFLQFLLLNFTFAIKLAGFDSTLTKSLIYQTVKEDYARVILWPYIHGSGHPLVQCLIKLQTQPNKGFICL